MRRATRLHLNEVLSASHSLESLTRWSRLYDSLWGRPWILVTDIPDVLQYPSAMTGELKQNSNQTITILKLKTRRLHYTKHKPDIYTCRCTKGATKNLANVPDRKFDQIDFNNIFEHTQCLRMTSSQLNSTQLATWPGHVASWVERWPWWQNVTKKGEKKQQLINIPYL